MLRIFTLLICAGFLLLQGCSSTKVTPPKQLQQTTASVIQIEDPWVRAVPPNANNSAIFLDLRNESEQLRKLVKVHSEVAERVEWQPRRRPRVEPHMRFRNQRQDDFGRDMSVRSDCWFVQNTLRQPSLTCLSRIAQGFGGGVPGRSDGQNDIDIHFAFS